MASPCTRAGVPQGKDIRIVKVAGDIEACAGTHCRSTGEIGIIKILRVEHIQDGIERIEFAAGTAAVYYVQHLEQIATSSADILSVQLENLPPTVTRFFTEWKDQKKEIERMSQRLVDLEISTIRTETMGGIFCRCKTHRSRAPRTLDDCKCDLRKRRGSLSLPPRAKPARVVPCIGRQTGERRRDYRPGVQSPWRQGWRETHYGPGRRAGCRKT